MVTLVLIAGPSGSGKSTVAARVAAALVAVHGNRRVRTLHQDDYFTAAFVPYRQRRDASFENGSGVDWDALRADIARACVGGAEPDGLGAGGATEEEGGEGTGETVVVVEGHMLGSAAAALLGACDGTAGRGSCATTGIVLALLRCSRGTCLRRRLRRRERPRAESLELETYFDAFVWPAFVEVGVPAMEALRACAETYGREKSIACPILELSTDTSTVPSLVDKITEAVLFTSTCKDDAKPQQDIAEP